MKLSMRHLLVAAMFLAASMYWLLHYNIDMGLVFRATSGSTNMSARYEHTRQIEQPQNSRGYHVNDIFVKLFNDSMYLYGACFPVGDPDTLHTELIVYGLEITRKVKGETYACCLQYLHDGNLIFKEANITKTHEVCGGSKVDPVIFVCDVKNSNIGVNPVGVSLALGPIKCSCQPRDYVKPYHPRRQAPGSLAVSNKLIFGQISSEVIIEWVETYRALGVDKIVSYASNDLNDAARRVLEYYDATGFLDLYRYDRAAPGVKRNWTQKRNQVYCDVNAVMIDATFKLAGYDYYSFVDLDEIMLPTRNRTLKQLLADLRLRAPRDRAASFKFKSKYMYTSWGKAADTDINLQQYIYTSPAKPKVDRPKLIRIQGRSEQFYIGTHSLHPIEDFKTATIPVEDGIVWHYRKCRKSHIQGTITHDQCMHTIERLINRTVADWSVRIEENVRRARRDIFESDPLNNTELEDFLKISHWD